MAAATSTVLQDIPPYVIGQGNPAEGRSINKVGLQRAGYSEDTIASIRRLFILFFKKGLNRSQALEAVEASEEVNLAEAKELIAFIRSSERGIV